MVLSPARQRSRLAACTEVPVCSTGVQAGAALCWPCGHACLDSLPTAAAWRRLGTPGGCCSRAATEPSCSWPPASPSSPRSTVRGPWQAAPALPSFEQAGGLCGGFPLARCTGPCPPAHRCASPWSPAGSKLVDGAELLCARRAGINAVLFYSPVIFTTLGSSQQAALLSAVAVRPKCGHGLLLRQPLSSVRGLEVAPVLQRFHRLFSPCLQ